MFKKSSGKSKTYRRASADTLSKSRSTLLKTSTAAAKTTNRNVYNKTLTNFTLGTFRAAKADKTYDSLRRPVGSLNCRRSSDHGISGTTRAILLTGGLEVSKEGFVSVKEAKFATQYRKRYVIFEQGLVKVYDPQVLKNLRLGNFKDPKEFNDFAEQKLAITELKNITYEKRKGQVFGLTFRTIDTNNSNNNIESKRSKTKSKHNTGKSNKSKSLSSPVNFANIAASLLPKKSEFTFYFKTASGVESDDWVQSILYEIRNQACFIDRTISMLQQRRVAQTFSPTRYRKTEISETMESVETDIEEKLDVLFRQSVDLWTIAKGKVSQESLNALQRFIDFLKEIESDEVEYWSQTVEIISKLLTENENNTPTLSGSFSGSFSEDISTLSGLEQLQKLNEEEFHLSSEHEGTFRSTIISTLVKKAKKSTNLSEMSPEIRRKKLTKRTFSDEQKLVLENNFKSALDMKEEREFEEDKVALQRISAKKLNFSQELNEERKESEITKML